MSFGVCLQDNGIPAHELDDAVWDKVMAVNVGSFFVASKYFLRAFLGRGGAAVRSGLGAVHSDVNARVCVCACICACGDLCVWMNVWRRARVCRHGWCHR